MALRGGETSLGRIWHEYLYCDGHLGICVDSVQIG